VAAFNNALWTRLSGERLRTTSKMWAIAAQFCSLVITIVNFTKQARTYLPVSRAVLFKLPRLMGKLPVLQSTAEY